MDSETEAAYCLLQLMLPVSDVCNPQVQLDCDTKIGNKVRVTNVPLPFQPVSFAPKLERIRMRKGICPSIQKSILNFVHVGKGVVEVEFVDKHIASELLRKKEATFDRTVINFEEFQSGLMNAGPSSVVASMQNLSPFGRNLESGDEFASPPLKKLDNRSTPKMLGTKERSTVARRSLYPEPHTDDFMGDFCEMPNLENDECLSVQNPFAIDTEETVPERNWCTLICDEELYDEATFVESRSTKFVLFSDVPDTFDENRFKTILHKKLLALDVLACEDQLLTIKYDPLEASVVVEFSDHEIAEKLIEKLPLFPFDGESLKPILHFLKLAEDNSRTKLVKFCGVPDTYEEICFKKVLCKKLLALNVVACEDQLLIITYDPLEASVVVEFSDHEIAEKLIEKLPLFPFDGESLKPILHFLKLAEDNSRTKLVKFCGVPDTYEEVRFKKILQKKLLALNVLACEDQLLIITYDPLEASVVVEFPNHEIAEKVTQMLPSFPFDGESMVTVLHLKTIHNIFDTVTIEDDLEGEKLQQHDLLKYSHYVLIKNVSPNYKEEEFTNHLHLAMRKAGFIDKTDEVIQGVLQRDPINNSVVVKVMNDLTKRFSTSEDANCAIYLENVIYRNLKLKLSKFVVDDNGNTPDVPGGTDSDDETEMMPLRAEGPGFTVFLKVLARFRDDMPLGGSHDPFLDGIVPVMRRFNVTTAVPEMRARKSKMRDNLRRWTRDGKETHPLYNIHCVIFSGADKAVLKNTVYEWKPEDEMKVKGNCGEDGETEEEKFMTDLTKFAEAPCWTNNSELAMVQLFLENKHIYDDPKRRIHFWRHLSNELYKMKYVYKPESCSSKYVSLSREYKELCENAEATGAPGPLELVKDERTRQLMEVMHQIKKNDVDVKPIVSMSAGLKETHKLKLGGAIPRPQGRTRHPNKKRDMSHLERHLTAEEDQSKALLLFAKAYAHKNSVPLEDD